MHYGRQLKGLPVMLNVYDLSDANTVLHDIGFGIYHSGVEISGTEHTFGQGGGIGEMTPKSAPSNRLFLYSVTIHFR